MNMQAASILRFLVCAAIALGVVAAHAQSTAGTATAATAPAAVACPALLQKTFLRLQDEAPQNLCQYAGRVLLVVNTASYCGYTTQYEGLEALYAQYAKQGLVILGFPANDFEQEPGSAKEIADLCFNTYGVKFPMFAKTAVTGPKANALYVALHKATGVPPKWNFHKYLIDRKGKVVGNYVSDVTPGDAKLIADVRRALSEK